MAVVVVFYSVGAFVIIYVVDAIVFVDVADISVSRARQSPLVLYMYTY